MRKHSRIQIDFGRDDITATVIIFADGSNEKPSAEEVRHELERNSVKYGISDEAILAALEAEYGVRTVVATGEAPKPGIDGVLHLREKPEKRAPKVLEDDKVDYHDLQLVRNIAKGQILAERELALPGRPGLSVKRAPIDPPPVREVELPSGKNTAVTPDGLKLVSLVDGHLLFSKDSSGHVTMNVEETFVLKKGVDLSTGNIDFIGSVVIGGTIREGFSVRAGGNITVKGQVEGATVESTGGVIVLEQGIKGQNKGVVKAKKEIAAKYIENARVEAEGDILVAEHIYHSTVRTRKNLKVVKSPGVIFGGEIAFMEGLECRQIGSDAEPRTRLFFGDWTVEAAMKRLREVDELIAELTPQMESLRKDVIEMRRLTLESPDTDRERIDFLAQGAGLFPKISERIKKLVEEKEFLASKCQKSDAKVTARVSGSVYHGVSFSGVGLEEVHVKSEKKAVQVILERDKDSGPRFIVKPLRG